MLVDNNEAAWFRVRFLTSSQDWRPVTWPPPGPYWYLGTTENHRTCLISYTRSMRELYEAWPEAENVVYSPESKIIFTHQYPEPIWWPLVETVQIRKLKKIRNSLSLNQAAY
jgi:hypothetical protein